MPQVLNMEREHIPLRTVKLSHRKDRGAFPALPFMAYSSPTYQIAKEPAKHPFGLDDQVDSTHGNLSNRMVGLTRQITAGADASTTPSGTDVTLFNDVADAKRGMSQHYRERRAALMSLEHAYEEEDGRMLEALQQRWNNFVNIFSEQEERLAKAQKEQDSLRSSSARAMQLVESLKKDILKLKETNCELVGQHQVFSTYLKVKS